MPRLAQCVPEARHRVQEVMRDWGEPDDRVDTAALVVTELVTNAVQHTAGRRIRCRVLRSTGRVRICVWNRGRGRVPAPSRPMDPGAASHARAPMPRRPELSHRAGDGSHGLHGPSVPRSAEGPGPVAMWDPDGLEGFDLASLAEDGRGLMLVDMLATRWGTRTSFSSRLVWADI
ncbi:Histidine kinase-, DNA gyrase B-, and HSP90-like ATPase [Streptomyces sp. ADI97-07]|uniref:ATP-binding protein n=1 Tax=Streptomyces sp. ADI97-07 TaxID=1522762 RepID=UPI000FAE5D0F|nr:ATP-binding protein [Streptomyces sp. ADI97-07]RPK72609.1 Histidine kinase-, DNA gyrase B-, and HSP90-like ATPase [Streptomyces sp. ADI97-07]